MIRTIRCQGYKAFNSAIEITLQPITVFFGKNNSGKTTLARLPIVIAAGLTNPNTFYSLSARNLVIGSSFMEIANAGDPHPAISYGVDWSQGRNLSVGLQHIATSEGQDRVQPTFIQVDRHRQSYQLGIAMPSTAQALIESSLPEASKRILAERISELRNLLDNLIHIASSRPKIQALYEVRSPTDWSAEEAPYQLQSNAQLLQTVDRWYQQHLDRAGIDIDQAAFAFQLVEQRGDVTVNFTQSGRGPQSAIPVVTLLTAVSNGFKDAPLVVVEEPEAHLHPSVHGDLADLVIMAASKSQIIVETHSENFLLRLRRRIAEKALLPSQLALYFINDLHQVHEVPIDEFGTTDHWPTGVFESDIEEARAIVEAKLSAISDRGDAV